MPIESSAQAGATKRNSADDARVTYLSQRQAQQAAPLRTNEEKTPGRDNASKYRFFVEASPEIVIDIFTGWELNARAGDRIFCQRFRTFQTSSR
jgi:hypothetical protein